MRMLIGFALLLTACATPYGQKVRVLLVDHEAKCNEADGVLLASIELAQERDFYLAEVIDSSTGDAFIVPSVRLGTQVVFTCPAGIELITVRTASVLSSSEETQEPTTAGPAPS
jgi:hypothetical protein